MNVGLRFTEDTYSGYVYPASGYMDVGGKTPGLRSALKVGRVFGWPDAAYWAQRAGSLPATLHEIGNEPNIETQQTPEQYVAYATDCAARTPSLRKISAAPSPSGAYLTWYAACDKIVGCEYTGAHVYGQTLDALITLTDNILANTKRKLAITELNFGPGADVNIDRNVWARSVLRPYLLDYVVRQPRIELVLYFADTWHADIPIGTPVDARGTEILTVLSEAANLPTDWNIGPGFKKCVAQLGWTVLENEVYHFPDDPTRKASMAVFDLGHATWDPRSNETVAIDNSGVKWSDGGNRPYEPDGKLVKLGRAP